MEAKAAHLIINCTTYLLVSLNQDSIATTNEFAINFEPTLNQL